MSHDYMLPVQELHDRRGIPVVFYDQIGTGRSTHLPEKNGDGAFWTTDLFCDELENLLEKLGISDDFSLIGQSWGGMLAATFALRKPKGLRRLILSNSPASMSLWLEAANSLRAELPRDVQKTLKEHEVAGTTESAQYETAVNVFYERHLCRVKPFPEPLIRTMEWVVKDPTVYHTMNGPNEFHVIGTLKDWSFVDDVPKLHVPTLVINGKYDECTNACVEPFLQNKHVQRIQMSDSSHTPMLEEPERYLAIIGQFLDGAAPLVDKTAAKAEVPPRNGDIAGQQVNGD